MRNFAQKRLNLSNVAGALSAFAKSVRNLLPEPDPLRTELRQGRSAALRYRRAVVILSLIGAAALTPGVLLQFGIVRHLPDPPLKGFNADRVSTSNAAYGLGSPDAPIGIASFAVNMILAGFGRADRATRHPWLPIAAAAKAAADVAAGGAYIYTMAFKEHAWCAYCLATAAAQFGAFAFTVPEALSAIRKR